MVWNDLIDLAFIDLAVIQPGASITTAMRTDAQSRLNMLVSALNAEGATVFDQVMQSFNLSEGVDAYTLGASGSWATTGSLRAQKVTSWRGKYSGILSRGGAPMSMAEFAARINQAGGETAAIPEFLAADTAYPSINIRVYPPPSGLFGAAVELGYWTPIAQISDFTAAISLPEGWPEMLHTGLAVGLYPQYARPGQTLDAIAALHQNAKARLVDQNSMGGAPQQQQG